MNPPRLATWLLQRWGSGPNRESLVGDLVEHYQRGRSPAWYWRQILRALMVGVFCEMWEHRFLAVRALVVGWVAIALTDRARWDILYAALGVPIGTPLHIPTLWFGLVYFNLTLVGSTVLSGWVVARCHRPYAISMVTTFAMSWALYASMTTIEYEIQAVGSVPPYWFISHLASELFAGTLLIPMFMMLGGLLGAGSVRPSRLPSIGNIA